MPIYFRPSMQDLPLTIDSIGNNWFQESVSRPKGFPLYHWLQTESGQGTVKLAGQNIILRDGEGILISPLTPHQYQKTGDIWLTSFLTFGGTLSNDIQKICGESPYLFVGAGEGRYFQKWIEQTLHSYLENSLDDLSLSVDCYEFLMHFSNIYMNHSLVKHPLYQQYVCPAIARIKTDYAEILDVDRLAFAVHVTPQYLTRLFRRFTGYSVQNYITRFRISKAKELLLGKPYLKVQSISHMCGYNDVSYFISVFKQHTGTTPKQFRKTYGITGS
ncbi:AraC family transcriptional regulator [Novisyntrophococcus fermenticellae]|uniref:AraC family transcriptional regulator n=1 Tax=Novisyntrophococcus fermenticellae TaxID=2068655 RepID=UPI001E3878D5|nr:AraC family transcriptional regulator [Novisyntrophococcus fermenticellae]